MEFVMSILHASINMNDFEIITFYCCYGSHYIAAVQNLVTLTAAPKTVKAYKRRK